MESTIRWITSADGAAVGWPMIVIAAVAVALIVVFVNGPKLFRGTRTVSDSFWCPFKGRLVTAEFGIESWDGERVDVTRCSAFNPPTAITCDKRCTRPRGAVPARRVPVA